MISIDGMRPDYITAADQHGLKIPNLRRIMSTGAHASSVRGVLPTVTYPSHTTLITGVWPSKHGIYNNTAFDPLLKNMGGWMWYSEDIKVETLWQAASRVGYQVGSVSWPVSVGAPGVSFLIPEYWRSQTAGDLKLERALSTPGLLSEFQEQVGPYITNLDDAMAGDLARTGYAEAIIRKKHARFLTLHLAALDHLEHAHGPFSPEANSTLEEIDKMVGRIESAMRAEAPNSIIAVVSDHGFAAIHEQLSLRVAFVKAGLITPELRMGRAASIKDWKAEPWESGGSAMIVLRDPNDSATRGIVEKLLHQLGADPANGIEQILDRKEIAAMGGSPNAEFLVDMKPGTSVGTELDGPLVRPIKPGGTHGDSPTHPEMLASFFIAGTGIRSGVDLGQIDMRSIAPTLAKLMGTTLPGADLRRFR